jgi:hypothetical protein
MIQSKTLIALGILGTLFFLTGVNVFSFAQISNDASMGGNMTNATMTTKTSGFNMSGMNEMTRVIEAVHLVSLN